MSLKGKVAIVTGASRGIGWVIAQRLAREGAYVVACARNPERSEAAIKEGIPSSGFLIVPVDISKSDQVEQMIQKTLDKFGGIHILINNAGITRDGLVVRMSLQEWEEVIGINLTGAFLCCRAVARSMIKQRSGVILNITSVVGLTGNAGQANYAASKAG